MRSYEQAAQEAAELATKRRFVEQAGEAKLADARAGLEKADRAEGDSIVTLQLQVEDTRRHLAAAAAEGALLWALLVVLCSLLNLEIQKRTWRKMVEVKWHRKIV